MDELLMLAWVRTIVQLIAVVLTIVILIIGILNYSISVETQVLRKEAIAKNKNLL